MENIHSYKNVLSLRKPLHYEFAVKEALKKEGLFLEFGVFQGRSIRAIANLAFPRIVYGFDSFEGLPEDWLRGNDIYSKGHFNLEGRLPEVPGNAVLIKGFFDETLEPWLRNNCAPISLLHIDCDLYSAAKHILFSLDNLIQPGTIIIFDELCDWKDSGVYPAWEEGEWKALNEWLETCNRKVVPISRGENFESTVRVID